MTQELYPYENAVMHITQAMIIPPIFNIKVTGETGSLNPIIKLVNTGKIENGYLIIEVEGRDGIAIGSVEYSRSMDISQIKDTLGIRIIGSDKDVTLDWKNSNQISPEATTGLFHLPLQSESQLLGAPILHLQLGVDTMNNTVSGIATVTQPIAKPVVCTSHVTGSLIYETVMKPGKSKIRIDLSGYPEIHWPTRAGVGPVIPKNFTAMILFDEDWNNGIVQYQYSTQTGIIREDQKIEIVRPSFSKFQLIPDVLELS